MPRRACSRPVLDATQASMQRGAFRTRRQDSWLLLLSCFGEMTANASLGIVGIFSSALPDIVFAGAREKPSCKKS